MRVLRPVVGGLAVGYVACVLAALWLKAAVPTGDVVWNFISPLRLGAWFLASAHGVPLVVRTAAGVHAPNAAGKFERLGALLGGQQGVVFSFSILLVPLTILAITGIATALLVRRERPSTVREVLAWSGYAAVAYGGVLAIGAKLSIVLFAADAQLAPDVGLGAATGRIAIGVGPRPVTALFIGAAWGAAFTAAGGMSAMRPRAEIDPSSRVVLFGWMRGLGVAAGIIAAAAAMGLFYALVAGRAPAPSLIGLGAFLLSGNAVASAVLAAHGVPLSVALDAGPFNGWQSLSLLHFGVSNGPAPKATWLLFVIPIVAGVVAGRFIRRRSTLSRRTIALRYGGLWGFTLAVLALLLRVRVLSSFSVGSLDLGGGGASFDPLIALFVGFAWGAVTSFVGAGMTKPSIWACPNCGMSNSSDDRFCVSCGASQPAATAARARRRSP